MKLELTLWTTTGAAVCALALGCQGNTGAVATTNVAVSSDAAVIGTGQTGGFVESDAVVVTDTHAEVGIVGADTGAVAASFNTDIGLSCAITGACPAGMKCFGVSPDVPTAYCTEGCSSDANCPPTFQCAKYATDSYCQRRDFCAACKTDDQCGAGGRCVTMGASKFCSKSCNAGKTECPRYSACQDVTEGGTACVHSSGSCAGDGSLCATCAATDNCADGGACLTFNYTKEMFCATPCATGGVCPTGFACADVGTAAGKVKECVPSDKKQPKCVSKLNPQMEEGDILDDFVMTGYLDTDQNGSVLTTTDGPAEEVRVIKFSEYAAMGFKIVLFNVAAGWCGPCQQETTTFKGLVAKYPDLGIYQVIYDGTTPGSLPTVKLAKSWASSLKGQGAVGVDPERNVAPWNTAGSTPLNLIVDAKTHKILKKMNGVPPAGIGSVIAPFMK